MTNHITSTDILTINIANITKSLSKARFDSYRVAGETDRIALSKYIWNLLLCESLYSGFQILEVAFRNSIHTEIAICAKDAQWLTNEIFLFEEEKAAIKISKKSISDRKGTLTEDVLVAEMSFGFWTSLLDVRYDTMWHRIIKGVFPNMPKTDRTRKEASKAMNTVRKLRNAALHHHSIWHWSDLDQQHETMKALIGYICNSSLLLYGRIDRFPMIHGSGYKECEKLLEGL